MDGVTFCGNCGAQMTSLIPSTQQEPQRSDNYNQPQVLQTPSYNSGTTNGGTYSTQQGNAMNSDVFPPKNYLTESIIVTLVSFLCCCSPISIILGIIAIVKANNVNPEFTQGNYIQAKSSSDAAKNLTIWAAVIAIIFPVIMVIAYFVFFAAIIAQAGGWAEFFNSMN